MKVYHGSYTKIDKIDLSGRYFPGTNKVLLLTTQKQKGDGN
jgi:hypothetical protein